MFRYVCLPYENNQINIIIVFTWTKQTIPRAKLLKTCIITKKTHPTLLLYTFLGSITRALTGSRGLNLSLVLTQVRTFWQEMAIKGSFKMS